ncbi:MAG: hypothetical protein H7A16_09160 [Sinobacteraceae bacterium]|nr:hypothetical protein [Nevskiaceae bacterium]
MHRRVLQVGISIAPGPMFPARRAFGQCLRLNCGHPWTTDMEAAIREPGRILRTDTAG